MHETCSHTMNSGFVYNSTLHNLHWDKLGRRQERNNVSAQLSCISPDWGQDGRRVNSHYYRGRKNYRVFTHYSRARKRMDGEDVCGSKIKVQFSLPGKESNVTESQNGHVQGRKGNVHVISLGLVQEKN